MKRFFMTVCLICLLAFPALAKKVPNKILTYATFKGGYIGAAAEHTRFDVTNILYTTTELGAARITTEKDKEETSSLLFFGWGYAWEPFYVGTEVQIPTSGASFPERDHYNYRYGVMKTVPYMRYQSRVSVDVRFGLLPSKESLVYLLAGVTEGKFEADYEDTDTLDTEDSISGWQIGVGGEKVIAKNVRIRAEYSHGYLGKETITAYTTNGFEKERYEVENDLVRLGVLYKF